MSSKYNWMNHIYDDEWMKDINVTMKKIDIYIRWIFNVVVIYCLMMLMKFMSLQNLQAKRRDDVNQLVRSSIASFLYHSQIHHLKTLPPPWELITLDMNFFFFFWFSPLLCIFLYQGRYIDQKKNKEKLKNIENKWEWWC